MRPLVHHQWPLIGMSIDQAALCLPCAIANVHLYCSAPDSKQALVECRVNDACASICVTGHLTLSVPFGAICLYRDASFALQ